MCCDKQYNTVFSAPSLRRGRHTSAGAVTSSWTHYEDQVSMLSKCHRVAGEFIEISPFHQTPLKSIFPAGVKCYVRAILYFPASLE